MTGQDAIAEALRQMIDGDDFTAPTRLVEDLTPADAVRKAAGSPYSVGTIVWHTWFWNEVWLAAIRGSGGHPEDQDYSATWPHVPAEDWEPMRDRFLTGLDEARTLAGSSDPSAESLGWHHKTVGKNLLQITVHTAYHVGQIALIRQELGLWPPLGGE